MDYDSDLPSHSCPDQRLLVASPPQDALRSRLLSWPVGNHPCHWQMATVFYQRMAYEVSWMFDWREVALASMAITFFAFIFWMFTA